MFNFEDRIDLIFKTGFLIFNLILAERSRCRKLGDALVDEDGADDNWVAGDNRRNAKVSREAAGLEVALRVEVPAGRLRVLVARVERPELAVRPRVERFDRRWTEPFEPFEPFEFFQNKNLPEFLRAKLQWTGIFPSKIQKFQKMSTLNFLNYRRNSNKISSKSEQKSVKRIQK